MLRQRSALGICGKVDMPSQLDRVARWRQLATKALVVASELTDPEAKQIMHSIAASYERLAQREEERGGDERSK